MSEHRYFVINKPYNMVSQFKASANVRLLGELKFDFPEGTHAIGRLDSHSEGLLLLTTNKRVTKLLFQGKTPHKRTYLVRVLKEVTPEKLAELRTGVNIIVDNGAIYTTPPCEVDIIDAPDLPDHQLELRPFIPHTWLRMSLYEGKFHQVRKMVAAVHHQCKRLVRESIEDVVLGDLPPGHIREMEEEDFFRLLKIDDWREQ